MALHVGGLDAGSIEEPLIIKSSCVMQVNFALTAKAHLPYILCGPLSVRLGPEAGAYSIDSRLDSLNTCIATRANAITTFHLFCDDPVEELACPGSSSFIPAIHFVRSVNCPMYWCALL